MYNLLKMTKFLICCAGSVLTAGCPFDIAHVSTQQTQFSPNIESQRTIVLQKALEINQAPCGYDRTLRQGTHWRFIGKLPEGEVFKPLDQVLTIECSNVFEAYLVVIEDFLVGFYLPVEKKFAPLSEKIKLPLNNIEKEQP